MSLLVCLFTLSFKSPRIGQTASWNFYFVIWEGLFGYFCIKIFCELMFLAKSNLQNWSIFAKKCPITELKIVRMSSDSWLPNNPCSPATKWGLSMVSGSQLWVANIAQTLVKAQGQLKPQVNLNPWSIKAPSQLKPRVN